MRGASQVQVFYCNEPFWLAHHKKDSETLETPEKRGSILKINEHLGGMTAFLGKAFA
jgi:hypothetical protein